MALAALLQADPRAVSIAAQLRAQQAIIGPKGLTIPAAYLDEFARAVVRWSGLDDIKRLKAERQTIYTSETESSGPVGFEAWVYNTPGGEGEPVDQWPSGSPGLMFALSADDKLSFWVRWIDPPGAPVFYVQPNVSESWWQPLVPLVAFAGAFIGLPGLLGEAILGVEAAAAYPVATKTLGSVALQTALTGGDIEAAARSAAASLVGAEFGNVVGSGLDSAQIGKIAAAAATAAVQGGDIDKAVLRSLVDIGARAMDEIDFPPGDFTDPVDAWMPTFEGDWMTLDDLGIGPGTVDTSEILADMTDDLISLDIDPAAIFPDEFGSLFLASGEFVEMSDVVFADSIYMDDEGNIRAPDNSIMIPSDEALNATADQLSAEIARQMDAGAGTVETSQPAPPSRPAAIPPAASQTKWPTIADTTKLLDAVGKLSAQLRATGNAIKTGTYRPPAGGTSTVGTPRNTPVGVPVTLPDGRVVTNNGNGTQTIRNPDGTTSTVSSSYSGASGAGASLLPGVSNQALLIGGAVLLGAVLLARRR
jgi:hypothetical protein